MGGGGGEATSMRRGGSGIHWFGVRFPFDVFYLGVSCFLVLIFLLIHFLPFGTDSSERKKKK